MTVTTLTITPRLMTLTVRARVTHSPFIVIEIDTNNFIRFPTQSPLLRVTRIPYPTRWYVLVWDFTFLESSRIRSVVQLEWDSMNKVSALQILQVRRERNREAATKLWEVKDSKKGSNKNRFDHRSLTNYTRERVTAGWATQAAGLTWMGHRFEWFAPALTFSNPR
ncbi:hypothetical protein IE53DRAFT_279319 [Violaceomyces palustris]|uniref:Uncharacterized protein n=1 Tax=Violaceomyces palustris TaxID=1673888 RepID=A0ACD0NMG8_9BASI|nr:hypothetical protein IE53DRAFT_279319 [Violaceomyces palustris]